MRIGGSLFLIAIGAILKWAVADHLTDVNLSTVGVILMVVGAIGLVLSLIVSSMRRRTDVIHEEQPRYVEQPDGRSVRSRTTYVEPSDRDPR